MSLSLSRWVTCQIYHAPTSRAPQTTTESHVHMEARCIPGKHPWSRRAWSRSTHAHLPSGGRCETVCAPLLPHASRSAPGDWKHPHRHVTAPCSVPCPVGSYLSYRYSYRYSGHHACLVPHRLPASHAHSSAALASPLDCRARATRNHPVARIHVSTNPLIDKSTCQLIHLSTNPHIDIAAYPHAYLSTYPPIYHPTYPHIHISTCPQIHISTR